MTRKHRKQDNPNWPEIAPTANSKTWRKEYNRLFKENLKVQASWQQAQQTAKIDMNASQSEALKLIQSLAAPPAKVLDVGSGPGFLTHALLSSGYDAYGCDCAEEAINFSKGLNQQHANRFFVCDAENVHSNKNKYDVVVCNQVIEHLKDPVAVMKGLWSLVKDEGHLVIGVPRGRSFDIAYHLSFYDTDNDFSNLLKSVFEEDGSYPTQFKVFQIQNTDMQFYLGTIQKKKLVLKYGLLAGTDPEMFSANDVIFDKPRVKTGVFNWGKLFDGQAYTMSTLGDPTKLDVIHIQISGTNFHMSRAIRNRIGYNSQTKIVATLDYAPQYWYMYPPFPDLLLDALDCADYITAVEPVSARLISSLLNGRDVHVIPHPADIERIRSFKVPVEQRQNTAFIMTHRDNEDCLPYFALRDSGLKTEMYGRSTPLGDPRGQQVDYPALMYNMVSQGYAGNQTLVKDHMAHAFLAYDSYTHHVCGRTAIEFAALGVPCIGYENVWAQEKCFPQLTVPTGRADMARELVFRLLEDSIFYEEVAKEAQIAVEFFGWDIARKRFLEMLGVEDADTRDNARPTGKTLGEKNQELRQPTEAAVEQPYESMGGHAVAAG